jgi:hypothetical protein
LGFWFSGILDFGVNEPIVHDINPTPIVICGLAITGLHEPTIVGESSNALFNCLLSIFSNMYTWVRSFFSRMLYIRDDSDVLISRRLSPLFASRRAKKTSKSSLRIFSILFR